MDIMNAAGECKRLDQVQELARTPIPTITVGGITNPESSGNKGTPFWICDAYGLNSLGLPNGGKAYYESVLSDMQKTAYHVEKKLRINIVGFDPNDWEELAELGSEYADEVEVNLGCPNVWGDDGQKPIASFHPKLAREIVKRVCDRSGKPCAVKLSPFSNPQELENMARVLRTLPIAEVVTSNTFANATAFDERAKPRIAVAHGLAGMSGPAMKPIALGQVVQLRALLPEHIAITGVGGIQNGKDVADFLAAGATKVQVGTHYFTYGAKVFSEILQSYAEHMEELATA